MYVCMCVCGREWRCTWAAVDATLVQGREGVDPARHRWGAAGGSLPTSRTAQTVAAAPSCTVLVGQQRVACKGLGGKRRTSVIDGEGRRESRKVVKHKQLPYVKIILLNVHIVYKNHRIYVNAIWFSIIFIPTFNSYCICK